MMRLLDKSWDGASEMPAIPKADRGVAMIAITPVRAFESYRHTMEYRLVVAFRFGVRLGAQDQLA